MVEIRTIFVWVFFIALLVGVGFLLKARIDAQRARSDREEAQFQRANRTGCLGAFGVMIVAGIFAYMAGTAVKKAEDEKRAVAEAAESQRSARASRARLAEQCRGRLDPQTKLSIGVCDGQGRGGSESLAGSTSCAADVYEFERKCQAAGY